MFSKTYSTNYNNFMFCSDYYMVPQLTKVSTNNIEVLHNNGNGNNHAGTADTSNQ